MRLVETGKLGRPYWMTPFGMERLGDVFFDRLWPEWRRDEGKEWIPSIDFAEKNGKYTLTAELPGLNKDDVSISIEDGCVTLAGKKEYNKEKEGSDYYVKETRYGSFKRSFRLPDKVEEDKVEATYKDGVLTVIMPKKEGSEKKEITIQ